MIKYVFSSEGITPQQIQGFYEGWPDPPSPETHLRLLANSNEVVLAVDEKTGNVVGVVVFDTARSGDRDCDPFYA